MATSAKARATAPTAWRPDLPNRDPETFGPSMSASRSLVTTDHFLSLARLVQAADRRTSSSRTAAEARSKSRLLDARAATTKAWDCCRPRRRRAHLHRLQELARPGVRRPHGRERRLSSPGCTGVCGGRPGRRARARRRGCRGSGGGRGCRARSTACRRSPDPSE
jgi:hypothetical protein